MASNLQLANLRNSCRGFYTRILNEQKAAIDYILLTNNVYQSISEVLIDEKGDLDIDSDHVLISFTFKSTNSTKSNNGTIDKEVWKFSDDTNRKYFAEKLKLSFQSWKIESGRNSNKIWEDWKTKVNNSANETIGKKRIPKNYKSFWDRDIKRLINERCKINKLKRKTPVSPELHSKLNDLYKVRKNTNSNSY